MRIHARSSRTLQCRTVILHSRLGCQFNVLFVTRREAKRIMDEFKVNGNCFSIYDYATLCQRTIRADQLVLAKVTSPIHRVRHTLAKKKFLSGVYPPERS